MSMVIGQGASIPPLGPTLDFFAADGSTTPVLGGATYPAAFYDSAGNKTWIAWEGWNGTKRSVRVRTYNHDTQRWGTVYTVSTDTLTNDNHGPPAICMDHEGYVHCFFGAHTSALKYAVSTNPRDPSAWTAKSSIGTDLTYPHPVLVGSTLYLFTRENNLADWGRRKTTALSGGAATWGSVKYVAEFTSNRFYQGRGIVVGTDIHFVAVFADFGDSLRRDVYHFVYHTSDDSVSNSTGSVTTAVASQPVSKATADASYIIVDQTTNQTDVPGFCRTSDGTLHVAYIDGSASPWDIKYINFNGTSWSSPTTVTTTTGSSSGFGYKEEIALVPHADGSIDLWYPDDDSSLWVYGGNMKRIVRSAAGSWGAASTILTADKHGLARPSPVVDSHADIRLIFCEDAQDTTAKDSAGGGLRAWVHGDSGFIPAERGSYAYFANVVFQATFTGSNGSTTFTDQSNRLQPISAAGNAQIQSNKLELDGTGDWLTSPTARAFGMIDDFCDEYFGVVFDSATTLQNIASQYDGATGALNNRGWALQYRGADATKNLALSFSTTGTSAIFAVQGNWTATVGQSYNIAVRRSGSTLRICVDGVMVASATYTGVSFLSSSPLAIGQSDTRASTLQNSELDGRIVAVRLHRGVDPYGNNDNYTVPSLPLPTS